jgi:toxin ParE1/3/4
MRLVLHPKVYSDIDEIVGYDERFATPGLAEEFYTKLRYFVTKAADKPESFSILERDIRRENLRRFPYHFLFRVVGQEIRILVVRHHHRHPFFGSRRR